MAERKHGQAQEKLEEQDPVRASIRERIKQDTEAEAGWSPRHDRRLIWLALLLGILFLVTLMNGEGIPAEYYLFTLVLALFIAGRSGIDRHIRRRMKSEPEEGANQRPPRSPGMLSMPSFELAGALIISGWWVIDSYDGFAEEALAGLIIAIAVVRVFLWNSFTRRARNTTSRRAGSRRG